jgi:hypothetical protein
LRFLFRAEADGQNEDICSENETECGNIMSHGIRSNQKHTEVYSMGNLFQPWHIIVLLVFVSPIALLFFFAIRFLSRSPRAEREAYYHAEVIKKIAESGAGSAPAIEYLREQERIKAVKRLGGIKLGGLINIAVGLALIPCLAWLTYGFERGTAGAVGLIPLFIGVALLVYAFWLAPKPEA